MTLRGVSNPPDEEKRRLVMHPTSIATSSPRSSSSAATVPCTPKAWREIAPHNDPGPSAPFRPRRSAALRERHRHGGRAAASSRLGAGQSAGPPRTHQSCFEPARPGMTERGREAWLLALREVVQALTEGDIAP